MLPEELIDILRIIKNFENKGVLINQKKIATELNITKPTFKKRVDLLIELNYISFEEKGNNKYVKITSLGNSFIN